MNPVFEPIEPIADTLSRVQACLACDDAPALLNLLQQSPSVVFARAKEGRTPIVLAAAMGALACLDALLPFGHLDLVDDNGHDALMKACVSDRLACAQRLLPHCDARRRTPFSNSAFLFAVRTGSVPLLRLLAPHSDVDALNDQGEGALCMAIQMSDLPVLRFLMTVCDVPQASMHGFSVLDYCMRNGRWSCLDVLAPLFPLSDSALQRAVRSAPAGTLPQLRARQERALLEASLAPASSLAPAFSSAHAMNATNERWASTEGTPRTKDGSGSNAPSRAPCALRL